MMSNKPAPSGICLASPDSTCASAGFVLSTSRIHSDTAVIFEYRSTDLQNMSVMLAFPNVSANLPTPVPRKRIFIFLCDRVRHGNPEHVSHLRVVGVGDGGPDLLDFPADFSGYACSHFPVLHQPLWKHYWLYCGVVACLGLCQQLFDSCSFTVHCRTIESR